MQTASYKERAAFSSNPIGRKLFALMEEKKSNLAVAADLTRAEELLALADLVGPEICVLKTHIDILEDFSPLVTAELRALADKHRFLIFEDRKFADIGNTVKHQYQGGIYRIADWSDFTNAHIVPGFGVIEGLREVGLPKQRALLLLAEMSSKGSLAEGSYADKAVELAHAYSDFVIGFISQRKLTHDPRFIHMTPGVQLQPGGDPLGQGYLTPETVIGQGSDVIIVGRGIYAAKDPLHAACIYKERGWQAQKVYA